MLPFVSVVVVTKNNAKTIEKCVENLLNQDYPKQYYEIVFVDGHSSDGTDEIIKNYAQKYQNIKLYYEDYGTIGYARNVGINVSKGEIIAYIDGDAYAPKDWIKKIVEAFSNDNKLAIIGGLDILVYNDKVVSGSRSIMDSWRRLEKKVGIKAIPCIKTVNFAIKRSVALACGGFDPKLSYWEEPELMSRIYVKSGITSILYNPQIVVYHQRLPVSLMIKIKKVFRNSVIGVPVFLRKHVIKVAIASPASPLATNIYIIFACAIGAPLIVLITLYGLLLDLLIILLPLFFLISIIYTFYAYLRTSKFAWTLPITLSLDCSVRISGTFLGLIKWLFNLHKLKQYKKRKRFSTNSI